MKKSKKAVSTYAFIDASNIIYGTRDENWKVDFKKLFKYLKERYGCQKIYYFAGVEKNNKKQQAFYKKLKLFGYELILKPVKIYPQPGGGSVRKANCDVDLTFYAMRDKDEFSRAIFFEWGWRFLYLVRLSTKGWETTHCYSKWEADGKRNTKTSRRRFYVNDFFERINRIQKRVDSTDDSTPRFIK